MRINFWYIFFVAILFASCSSSRKVVKKTTKKESKEEVVTKKEKIPSVDEKKHVKKLKKGNVPLDKHALKYIETYAPIAVFEMHSYKIPASITLAQGILESGKGRSELAVKSKNHFGIKCHKGWTGDFVTHDDDEKGECFRKYKHVKSSYEDHSKFLTSRRRYANLFKLRLTDYKGWAYGLKKAGYATDRRYPKKLIKIIEDYDLHEFDKLSKKDVKKRKSDIKETEEVVEVEELPEIEKIDGKTYYVVSKGDTLFSIAKRFKTSIPRLKKINNLKGTNLSIGQKLFIR